MNAHRIIRMIAGGLVNHAARVLPAKRAAWARAMVHEVDHIASDGEALRWALGCVLASYQAGLEQTMHPGLEVSRWLLGLEILVCLGPLTLLWMVVLYIVVSGEAALAGALVPTIGATIIGTLGPIALWLGLRAVFLRHPVSRNTFAILAAGFAALAAIQFVPNATWFAFDWQVLMLNSILPAIACVHLALVAPDRTTAAGSPETA